jgi:4-hydroxyphenylpyruvate dioxygenase
METVESKPSKPATDSANDFLPLNGTDYIELYVANAWQSAHYFQTAFGFQPLAHAGLETGWRDRESYVVVQGKIRLVLTSPLHGPRRWCSGGSIVGR